jgi:hypothetical protein
MQSKKSATLVLVALLAIPGGLIAVAPTAAAVDVPSTVGNHFQAAQIGYRFDSENGLTPEVFTEPAATSLPPLLSGVLESANGYLVKTVNISGVPQPAANLSDPEGQGLVERITPAQVVTTNYDLYAGPANELVGAAGMDVGFWYDGRLVDPTLKSKGPAWVNFDQRKEDILAFCGVEKHYIDISGLLSVDENLTFLLKVPLLVALNPHNSNICRAYLNIGSVAVSLGQKTMPSLTYVGDDGQAHPFKFVIGPEDAPRQLSLSQAELKSLAASYLDLLTSPQGEAGTKGGRIGHLLVGIIFNPWYALYWGADCSVGTIDKAVTSTGLYLGLEIGTPGAGNCLKVLHAIGTNGVGTLAFPSRFVSIEWKAMTGAKFGATELFAEILAIWDACNDESGDFPVVCAQSWLDCYDTDDAGLCILGGVFVARDVLALKYTQLLGDVDGDGKLTEMDKRAFLSVAVGNIASPLALHKVKNASEHYFGLCTWQRYSVAVLLNLVDLYPGSVLTTGGLLYYGIAAISSIDPTILNHMLVVKEKQWSVTWIVGHADGDYALFGPESVGKPNRMELGYFDDECIAGLDFFNLFYLLTA